MSLFRNKYYHRSCVLILVCTALAFCDTNDNVVLVGCGHSTRLNNGSDIDMDLWQCKVEHTPKVSSHITHVIAILVGLLIELLLSHTTF